jgi:hypothetical protein
LNLLTPEAYILRSATPICIFYIPHHHSSTFSGGT